MDCKMCDLCRGTSQPGLLGRILSGASTAKDLKSVRVMLLVDNPTATDEAAGRVFFGKSCDAFVNLLEQAGISRDEVYVTALTKCHTDTPDKLKPAQKTACGQILAAEFKLTDPDIVIPMGTHSVRWCGGVGTINQRRGNARQVNLYGRERVVLPIFHPGTVGDRPGNKEYILKDVANLADIFHDGLKKREGLDYRYLETVPEIEAELRRMQNESQVLSFDIESTTLNPWLPEARVVSINLSDRPKYGVSIPLYHPESPLIIHREDGTEDYSQVEYVVSVLKELLEDARIPKVAHNGKFDTKYLQVSLGIHVAWFCFDTMYGHYIAVSEELNTQGLKSQTWEFIPDMGGYDDELDDFKEALPEAKRHNYGNIPWNILKSYGAADADCALRLFYLYSKMIAEEHQWQVLMDEIMMPACAALRDMEINGLKVDRQLAASYAEAYAQEKQRIESALNTCSALKELEAEASMRWAERQRIASIPRKERTREEQAKFEQYKKYQNWSFNWASTAQVSDLLFNRLGLTTEVTNDSGKMSTNEEALKEMALHHEVPRLMLELRKVNILIGLVVNKIPTLLDSEGLLHPSFNQCGTVTGRLSSQDPNIQQMPRAAENPTLFQYHHEPKGLFVSRYGDMGCMLNADYSALEVRLAAVISGDQRMLEAFLSGADFHKSAAAMIWGVPVEKVGKDLRTQSKSVTFGVKNS